MIEPYSYDIHGVVTVQSESLLPELESFRTAERIDKASVEVRLRHPNVGSQGYERSPSGRCIRYNERLGPLGFAVEIAVGDNVQVSANPILTRSPHVLYTNVVEPILRWSFVEKGYALVHGACVTLEDRAYLITARTDTGKTTTMLRILSADRHAGFVADDLTLVGPNGRVFNYPKPLTISQHTVQAVNPQALSAKERVMLVWQSRVHSRPSRRLALFLARTRLPMATVNTLIQWVVPPPKYHVPRLVPGVRIVSQATIGGLFVIERGSPRESALTKEEAMRILFQNCEDAYGFPPYHAIESFLSSSNGRDLRAQERAIVREAFHRCPALLLCSDQLDWWKRIPSLAELMRAASA